MVDPDSISIRVCVLALVVNDDKHLTKTLPKMAPDGEYNLPSATDLGYSGSPNDWRPYDDDTIDRYLEEAYLDVTYLSGNLPQPGEEEQLIRFIQQVDMYIVDPLFLVTKTQYADLIHSLDTMVATSDNKALCVVVSNRIPPVMLKALAPICKERLRLVQKIWTKGNLLEFEAHNADRLTSFLTTIRALWMSKKDLEKDGTQQLVSFLPKMSGR